MVKRLAAVVAGAARPGWAVGGLLEAVVAPSRATQVTAARGRAPPESRARVPEAHVYGALVSRAVVTDRSGIAGRAGSVPVVTSGGGEILAGFGGGGGAVSGAVSS